MKLAERLLIEHLRGLAGAGKTRKEVSSETGIHYSTISRLSKLHNIAFPRQMMPERPPNRVRAQTMRQFYENGETLEQIGTRFGITRERVRQILAARFGTNGQSGGASEKARRKRRDVQKKQDARSLKVWGCLHREYLRILRHKGKPTYAYWAQRRSAIHRGIGWELNLHQWWQIWETSGQWEKRGRGRAYQMCRLNDTGPYSVDNVYIATGDENMRDYWVNRRAFQTTLEVAQ